MRLSSFLSSHSNRHAIATPSINFHFDISPSAALFTFPKQRVGENKIFRATREFLVYKMELIGCSAWLAFGENSFLVKIRELEAWLLFTNQRFLESHTSRTEVATTATPRWNRLGNFSKTPSSTNSYNLLRQLQRHSIRNFFPLGDIKISIQLPKAMK